MVRVIRHYTKMGRKGLVTMLDSVSDTRFSTSERSDDFQDAEHRQDGQHKGLLFYFEWVRKWSSQL
jgi:hypothetical protein